MTPELSLGLDFLAIACTLGYLGGLFKEYFSPGSDGTSLYGDLNSEAWGHIVKKKSLFGQVVMARSK